MAKFYGTIGYSVSKETAPGVWTDEVVECPYTGDVIQTANRWRSTDNVNPDVAVSNTISIVADGFLIENAYSMKYVKWRGGAKLSVVNVRIERPRVIVEIGGLYNGSTTAPPNPS